MSDNSSVLISAGSPGSPVQQAKLRKRVEEEQAGLALPLRKPLVKTEIKTEADPIDKIDKKYLHQVADNNKMKKGAR